MGAFDDLVGNRTLNARLATMARTGKVPPSLLFTGPAGVGKLETATALAMAENCLSGVGEACRECAACTRIVKGEHPDVLTALQQGKKGEADAMRTIVRDIHSRPFEARRRVVILVDAERMHPTTANILLKTLEEPPEWALLILVTSNAAFLLPTIRSRCQIYRFAPLAAEDVKQLLTTKHGMDDERATLLSALSVGSLTRALELEDESLAEVRDEAFRAASVVSTSLPDSKLVPWAESLARNDQLLLFLQLLIGICRDVASSHSGGTFVHRDRMDEIERLRDGAPLSGWIEAHSLAESTLTDVRDRYLNKRISMGHLLNRLNRIAVPS